MRSCCGTLVKIAQLRVKTGAQQTPQVTNKVIKVVHINDGRGLTPAHNVNESFGAEGRDY